MKIMYGDEIPVSHRAALRDVITHHFVIDGGVVRVSKIDGGYLLQVPDKSGKMRKHAEIMRGTGEVRFLNRKGKIICCYTVPIVGAILGGLHE